LQEFNKKLKHNINMNKIDILLNEVLVFVFINIIEPLVLMQ
jgi:hypothetical protein